MKFHPAARAALLLALAPFPALALDLTPKSGFRELEGMKVPVVHFSDAGGTITYQPPLKWNISGGDSALSFYPPEAIDAVMQFRLLPRRPLAEGQTEDLDKWCRTFLPADATKPTLETQAPNVFTLGQLSSLEFTYSYAAAGRRFNTSIAIVDWSDSQRFTVIITARATDFKAIHDTGIGSLFTWSTRK